MSGTLPWTRDAGDDSAAPTLTRWLDPALRTLLVAAALWLCVAAPGVWLLEALLPAQRFVFTTLMPEFDVRSFALERRGGHVKVRVASVNQRYLVLGGHAVPPGFAFEVETPARAGLLNAALVVAGAALTLRRGRRLLLAVAAIVVPVVVFMLTTLVPLTLAGQQWGLGIAAFGELSLPALWVAASDFLLYGGSFAICAAAVWLAKAATDS